MDWGRGRYEQLAPQVLPAAQAAVERLAVQPGETVLDVGCGSGNATLLTAAGGGRVLAIDPAARLLHVARAAALERAADATFAQADAVALPARDRSIDAVVSVFGVIFAADAQTAAAEMFRVLKPGGRLVITAWLRTGPLAAQAQLRSRLVSATRQAAVTTMFPWHEPDELRLLFAASGVVDLTVDEQSLHFTAASPEAYVDAELAHHPGWVSARGVLEPAGKWGHARSELIRIFTDANEEASAFRATSRYVIATAIKPARAA